MTYYKTQLHLQNKPVSVDPRFTILYHYSVERDNFGNWKYFDIKANKSGLTELSDLKFLGLNKNIYYSSDGVCYVPDTHSYLIISDDDLNTLRKNMLNANPLIPVIQLNIKCDMKMVQTGGNLSALGIFGEQDRWDKYMTANLGYYSTLIAVTLTEVTDLLEHATEKGSYPKLRTDFWKHGQAGIIDVLETIKPCYWYGKQHPFEFSFIAGNDSVAYKQFTNLLLFTNYVPPESIHYTIDADTYTFSDDKTNMYIRLEATKAFYQLNGSDILYDHDAFKCKAEPITSKDYIELDNNKNYLRVKDVAVTDKYKATILPLYYSRLDTFNEIEDYYKRAVEHLNNTDYPNLAGGEVIHDTRLDHFAITNHVKMRDIKKVGRSRGNLEYHNGYYAIQINPLNIYLKNETWKTVPPINLANAPVPEDMSPVNIRRIKNVWELLDKIGAESHGSNGKDSILDVNDGITNKILTKEDGTTYTNVPDSGKYLSWTRELDNFVPKDVYKFGYTLTDNIDFTNWEEISSNRKEVKLYDTHIKILIRYSGDKLVLVKAVNTIFEPRV